MSLYQAANFAASLLKNNMPFRDAVSRASKRFGIPWDELRQELSTRSAEARSRPEPEPEPEVVPEPEAGPGQSEFDFGDDDFQGRLSDALRL